MEEVRYPDSTPFDLLGEVLEDRTQSLVLTAEEWDRLAVEPPAVIPELAKLFSEPTIFEG